jgi:hypothetical protein
MQIKKGGGTILVLPKLWLDIFTVAGILLCRFRRRSYSGSTAATIFAAVLCVTFTNLPLTDNNY